MGIKFSESRLWVSIILVLFYLFLTDLFVDYVISREVDGFLQAVCVFVFLVMTFYVIKGMYLLWKPKKNVEQVKQEEE